MKCIVQSFQVAYRYPVFFGKQFFGSQNEELKQFLVEQCGGSLRKILVYIDSGLAKAQPALQQEVTRFLDQLPFFQLACPPKILQGGEEVKDSRLAVEGVLQDVDYFGIDRHSFILAIGGGAMLDAVGFAAAQAHRGVKLIRMPSTVLAQNDAGIGVKNGINLFGKKNFAGHFSPPVAVFNDFSLLSTLDDRHFIAGYAEAVKVALIKDAAFFKWLEQHAGELACRQASSVEYLIEKCAALHLAHISSGDPFESGSSRPLDYGHWLAHKLEKLSKNQVLHGEAVAIGMAIDAYYATQLHGLNPVAYDRIVQLLRGLGFELRMHRYTNIDFGIDVLLAGLEEFREHLGGDLCISMITEIGQSLDVNQIDHEVMRKAILAFE